MTVQQIAEAIAHAEGFYVKGSFPQRNNNPGDLTSPPYYAGQKTIEKQKAVFSDLQDGWNALYHQLNLIVNSKSRCYTLDMTLQRMAHIWTGGDNPLPWANTVAQKLGVTINTTLDKIFDKPWQPSPTQPEQSCEQ